MSEQGRAWFYLTLWRGTPSEATHFANVVISRDNGETILISTTNAIEAELITTESRAQVDINRTNRYNARINMTTEVEVHGNHRKN